MASTASALIRTLRPHQWVKNAFVLAPLVFSKHLFELSYGLRAAAAVAIFCGLSGAIYTLNDIRDLEADRRHPVKRDRPIPSGQLSIRIATMSTLILGGLALLASLGLGPWFSALAAAYVVNNLAYSFGLKRIAYLDVFSIAGGFLIRVAAGSQAIGVESSAWLLACTALLAAFLGYGKRVHELRMAEEAGQTPSSVRRSLAGYSLSSLQALLTIFALAACTSFALYTRDPRTIDFFGTDRLLWTLPFCLIGIFRFLQLALWAPSLVSPTEAIVKDLPFLLNFFAWAAAVIFLIYGM